MQDENIVDDDGSQNNYIDYSCSTSVERLARDVETILQAWHVTHGSDRHVSLTTISASTTFQRRNSCSSIPSHSPVRGGGTSNIHPVNHRWIRSEQIVWNLALSGTSSGQAPATIPVCLQLSLCDGPAPAILSKTSLSSLPSRNNATKNKNVDDQSSLVALPLSLQRQSALATMPANLFENPSLLFGIGQHITLTLVPLSTSDDSDEPIEIPREFSKDDHDIRPTSHTNHTLALFQALVLETAWSVWERHTSTLVTTTVLQSIWSGWLQTALNLAASSCQCAIPVFGIWAAPEQLTEQRNNSSRQGGPGSDDNEIHTSWMWWKPLLDVLLHVDDDTSSSHIVSEAVAWFRRARLSYYQKRRKTTPSLKLHQLNTAHVPSLLNGQLVSVDCSASFVCSEIPLPRETIYVSTWADLFRKQTGLDAVALWGAKHVFEWTNLSVRGRHCDVGAWRKAEIYDNVGVDDADHADEQAYEVYKQQCQHCALSLLEEAYGTAPENPLWGPLVDPVASIQAKVSWNGIPYQSSPGSAATAEPLLTFPLKIRSHRINEADWRELQESTEGMILNPLRSSDFYIKVRYDAESAHATLAATMRCVLAALIRTATLPPETLCSHLVDTALMQAWDNDSGNVVASTLAEAACVSNATQALVTAMDWANAAADMIDAGDAHDIVQGLFDESLSLLYPANFRDAFEVLKPSESLCLKNAAPPGRLLSLLFAHMARVRSPSSVALVWQTFVHQLRQRWERRVPIPNMRFLQPLDPVYDPPKTKQRFSALNALDAVSLHNHEPDPDSSYCLVGQKLQLYNVCLENIAANAHLSSNGSNDGVEQCEKRPRLDNNPESAMDGQSDSDEFYDTHEDDHVHSTLQDAQQETESRSGRSSGKQHGLQRFATESLSARREERRHSPSLQRALPLTDDVIAERKQMIAKQDGATLAFTTTQTLDLVLRLQRPKLLSDVMAYKAANSDSKFEDFVVWYGEPTNPMNEYMDADDGSPDNMDGSYDDASECIRNLAATRQFWSEVWEQAEPLAADDQPPLFDGSTLLEMSLDFLETLHPASLMCQVTAVNLSSAYFALRSLAGDALKVGTVYHSFGALRKKIESAIELITTDVLNSTSSLQPRFDKGIPSSVASVVCISACERACVALGDFEGLLSRAISLLQKLPKQYELVDILLRSAPGSWIKIVQESSQEAVVQAMSLTQAILRPMECHYRFRELECTYPCQMSVAQHNQRGEATIALSKSSL